MYRLNEAKMFYDIGDNQAIIIDSSTGLYYALNELGSAVFDALAKGAGTDVLLSALRSLAGTPEDVETQLQCFVDRLLGYDILLPAGTVDGVVITLSDTFISSGFAFELDQFDDAQEIMLADPVHDVDLDEGWPILKSPDEKK